MVLPYLTKLATWLTPQKKQEKELGELHHIKYLDSKYISTPSVALSQARAEIIRMGEAVQVMYDDVIHSLKEWKLKGLAKWRKREDALDILRREITQFLVRLMQSSISEDESKEVRSLIRMVNNLERIGDSTENIAELMEELIEKDLSISDEALNDYKEISGEGQKFLRLILTAMRHEDKEIMPKAQEIEAKINRMEEEMKENHLIRLQSGVCTIDAGLIFVNILTAFERIGGFCYNISQAVAGLK
jgi:phosphate:Na+ symporter